MQIPTIQTNNANSTHNSLFNLTQLSPIERLHNPTPDEIMGKVIIPNRAAILTGLIDSWPCTQKWDMEYIRQRVGKVKVQKPKESGVYHFLSFDSVPIDVFVESLNTTKDLYLSADPIMGEKGSIKEECQLKALAEDIPLPDFIPKNDIYSCNLWIGPGGNRSLLHYDAWHSFLAVFSGEKRFCVYHPSQTPYLHQYSLFDLKSLKEGKTMDSKLNPADIQEKYNIDVREAVGFEGTLHEGEALFIPAGTWHYVESHGLNIALNYFYQAKQGALWNESPLKEYNIKANYLTPMIDIARKIKKAIKA